MNRQADTARLDVPDFGDDGSVTLEVAAWHVAEGQQVRAGPVISLRSGRLMIELQRSTLNH